MSTQDGPAPANGYREKAARNLLRAGDNLSRRQALRGPLRGNVGPWTGCDAADFHGTLSSIWVWSRAQILAGEARFGPQVGAAWGFVEANRKKFIPDALDADAGPEAAYDCAMLLRACLALHALAGTGEWRRLGDDAARMLMGYLVDGHIDEKGRGFADPGFMAWTLAVYARVSGDRGMLSVVSRFVDGAFGMGKPAPFAKEPQADGALFDFSCTGATAVLAVAASEGDTPFVGTWLRERVFATLPVGWTVRTKDENSWNAWIALLAGKAYVLSTDERFAKLHADLVQQLVGKAGQTDGAPGRADEFPSETLATFHYALALAALVPVTKREQI